jgi:hypothetical protein
MNFHFSSNTKFRINRGESQYELDDNIFSIEIGIDVKHINGKLNFHGIEIDSKNRNWNWI